MGERGSVGKFYIYSHLIRNMLNVFMSNFSTGTEFLHSLEIKNTRESYNSN
jgi:hypothetical protein